MTENRDASSPSSSRTRSLALVTLAYAMALAAGWITILVAPIDDPIYLTLAADVVATLIGA